MNTNYSFKEDQFPTQSFLYKLKNACVLIAAFLIGFSFCFLPELREFVKYTSLVLLSFVVIYYIVYFFRFLIKEKIFDTALLLKIIISVLLMVFILLVHDKLLVS